MNRLSLGATPLSRKRIKKDYFLNSTKVLLYLTFCTLITVGILIVTSDEILSKLFSRSSTL